MNTMVVLLGVVALLFVIKWAFDPRKNERSATKKCECCGRQIPFSAKICPVCGRDPGTDWGSNFTVYGKDLWLSFKRGAFLVVIIAAAVMICQKLGIDLSDIF